MTSPETEASGDAGKAGTRFGVPAAARVRARTTIRRASSILKPLSPEAFACASVASAARVNNAAFARLPARMPSASRAPRPQRDAAEREARLHDRGILDAQRRRRRYDRECIGRAFANLQVAGMRGETGRLGRQAHGDDHLAGLQHALAVGRVPRQPVKHVERDLAPPAFAFDLDDGVERDQRHAEIGRVGRNAVLAPPQHRVQPVVAAAGVAARTGRALVAGAGDVIEVSAARPLQEIAADRGGVAKLRGRSGQKRLGDRRKATGESPIVSEVGVADERADAHAPVGKVLDIVEAGKMADIHQAARAAHAAFHQVEQVGAGGQIGGARFRRGRNRFAYRCRPHIVEGLHATSLRPAASSTFCASSTASVIPR